MPRPRDTIEIEAVDSSAGTFDAFTSIEVVNDLTAPSEASFEVGDDGTYKELEDIIAPASQFRVVHNGKLRLTGRVGMVDVPVDPQGGATVRFVVRTKLADAAYCSADPTLSVQNASLKSIVTRAYAKLGYKDNDFVFRGDVSRDLMTGKSSRSGDKPADLEPIQLEQAKVAPPETIFEFVERHLNRFHFSHWDCPDGRIMVGAPNDLQDPLYYLQLKRGPSGRANNLLSAHRTRDIEDSPSSLAVVGMGGKWNYKGAAIRHRLDVEKLAKFYRPVIIVDEQVRSKAQAIARVTREITARTKKLDAWEVTTDGWSFWDGSELTPYGVDTVADVSIDGAGGSTGPYLVHRVACKLDPSSGFTSSFSLLRRGIWRL